jgi:hypothetical protein
MFDFYNKTGEKGLNTLLRLTISQELLVEIAINLQDNIQCGENVKGKMFAIFIELAQNVHTHSAEKQGTKHRGIGILSITETSDYYLLSSGNKIQNNKVTSVIERCNHINSLDKEALRAFYRSERTVSFHLKRTKGAYLGFIDMVRRSQNPLKVQVDEIDEETSFLSITVKVNKPTIHTKEDKQNTLSISA